MGFVSRLNFMRQCQESGLSLWQCPNFLFVLMGVLTIVAMLASYFIGRAYTEPEIVLMIVFAVTVLMIILGYGVVSGFDRLAQANRLKTEFISVASHQLRTPLSAIRWSLGLFLDANKAQFSPEQKEQLLEVKDNNQRMIKLVNDLLDVSRIEQGRFELRPEKLDLRLVAQAAAWDLSAFAQANNVELKTDFVDSHYLVMADLVRIRLVVQNLVDNAIKYIKDKGEVLIRVWQDKGLVYCSVKDNGVGIPVKEQRNIFQKFFRSQNIMKYQTQGSGLGLYIAKAVVEESGGKLGFESEEGKGSRFWFCLPLSK